MGFGVVAADTRLAGSQAAGPDRIHCVWRQGPASPQPARAHRSRRVGRLYALHGNQQTGAAL